MFPIINKKEIVNNATNKNNKINTKTNSANLNKLLEQELLNNPFKMPMDEDV